MLVPSHVRLGLVVGLALASLLTSSDALAQVGSIRGKVLDSDGNPVADAVIVLRATQGMGFTFKAKSETDGTFVLITSGTSGPFTVKVSKEGFKTWESDRPMEVPLGFDLDPIRLEVRMGQWDQAATSSPALAEQRAYGPLVDRYLDGDHVGPVIELGNWEEPRLRRSVDAIVAQIEGQDGNSSFPSPRLMAGALLHTERAVLDRQSGLTEPASNQIEMAWSYVLLLERMSQRGARGPELSAFCRRWYRLAGLQALGALAVGRARQLLDDGLRRHPGDGGLLLALGSVEELLAQFGEAESRPPGNTMEATRPPEWMRRRAEKARRLEKAEKLFTRALAAEPTLVEARLRRGRTLQLLERASDAESDLARVARETRDPNILYLSHLFRGRLQEKGGDLSAASESYRAAAELGQRPQAANIGLAHVLDLLGDRAGAAEALDRAVAKPTETGPLDGWWEYTFGQPLDAEALIEGLRREVHR